jgi:hypothetical protein
VERRALRHTGEAKSHRRGAGFGNEDVIGLEEIRPARIERIDADGVVAAACDRAERGCPDGGPYPLRKTLRERGKQIADFDAGIGLALHLRAMMPDRDRLCRVEMGCEGAGVEVGHRRPDIDDQVAVFDESAHFFVYQRARTQAVLALSTAATIASVAARSMSGLLPGAAMGCASPSTGSPARSAGKAM